MGARFIIGILGCLAGLGISVPALAETEDTTMAVGGQVINRCGVRADPMDFGTIATSATGEATTTATFTVRCTETTFVTITFDNGLNAIGNQRRLANGSGGFLNYQVYANAAHTQRLGPGAFRYAGTTPGINDHTFTLYGQIPSLAGITTGAYNDVVTLTVEF